MAYDPYNQNAQRGAAGVQQGAPLSQTPATESSSSGTGGGAGLWGSQPSQGMFGGRQPIGGGNDMPPPGQGLGQGGDNGGSPFNRMNPPNPHNGYNPVQTPGWGAQPPGAGTYPMGGTPPVGDPRYPSGNGLFTPPPQSPTVRQNPAVMSYLNSFGGPVGMSGRPTTQMMNTLDPQNGIGPGGPVGQTWGQQQRFNLNTMPSGGPPQPPTFMGLGQKGTPPYNPVHTPGWGGNPWNGPTRDLTPPGPPGGWGGAAPESNMESNLPVSIPYAVAPYAMESNLPASNLPASNPNGMTSYANPINPILR